MEHKKFYEMDIWKEAFSLQKAIFELTQTFPKEERFGLGSQLNNATNSVAANIAEAHGRYYFADKIRVLYTVRGEIEETQSHIFIAHSRGYVSEEKRDEFITRYEQLNKKLNTYIGTLAKQK